MSFVLFTILGIVEMATIIFWNSKLVKYKMFNHFEKGIYG
jgi:hypothetical protein